MGLIISRLEEEARQRQQQQQQQGGAQPSQPMEDSMPAKLKGPGHVERRDIGNGSGWGDLADKDREQALQQVGREFPAHYRQVIEQYFRRLASDEEEASR